MTKELILARGEICLVDDEDFHWVSQRSWYRNAGGYAECPLWGRRSGHNVLMHRLILLAHDTATVDHANGNRLDNRRSNLRLATMSQQNANKPKYFGSSKYKGVHRRCDGRKWVAQIKANKSPTIHLGSFESEEDAARAYNEAAMRMNGSFARPNAIKESE